MRESSLTKITVTPPHPDPRVVQLLLHIGEKTEDGWVYHLWNAVGDSVGLLRAPCYEPTIEFTLKGPLNPEQRKLLETFEHPEIPEWAWRLAEAIVKLQKEG